MHAQYKEPPTFVSLSIFCLLSLGISWMICLPQALVALGFAIPAIPLASPLVLLATWGPGIAALIVTFITSGWSGVKTLLSGLRRRPLARRWYLILFLPVLVWHIGRGTDVLMGQHYELESPLALFGTQAAFMLPFLILFAFPSTMGEELGWRGFALPQLLEYPSSLGAGVIPGYMAYTAVAGTGCDRHRLSPVAQLRVHDNSYHATLYLALSKYRAQFMVGVALSYK